MAGAPPGAPATVCLAPSPGSVDISQDGKSEPHEVPAKDGISVPVAPGMVCVNNTGTVPLLMTIVPAS